MSKLQRIIGLHKTCEECGSAPVQVFRDANSGLCQGCYAEMVGMVPYKSTVVQVHIASLSISELGRHAITLRFWEWIPGMLLIKKTLESGENLTVRIESGEEAQWHKGFPDLEDEATKGCVRSLAQKRFGDLFYTYPDSKSLRWYGGYRSQQGDRHGYALETFPTEIHATIAALV